MRRVKVYPLLGYAMDIVRGQLVLQLLFKCSTDRFAFRKYFARTPRLSSFLRAFIRYEDPPNPPTSTTILFLWIRFRWIRVPALRLLLKHRAMKL